MIATMGGGIGTVERSGRRILAAYLLLLGLVAVVGVVVLRAGADRRPAPAIGGVYRLDQAPPCIGTAGAHLRLEQSGQFVGLDGSTVRQLKDALLRAASPPAAGEDTSGPQGERRLHW